MGGMINSQHIYQKMLAINIYQKHVGYKSLSETSLLFIILVVFLDTFSLANVTRIQKYKQDLWTIKLK